MAGDETSNSDSDSLTMALDKRKAQKETREKSQITSTFSV